MLACLQHLMHRQQMTPGGRTGCPVPALQDHFILIFVSGHMTVSNAHQLLECPGDSHFTEVFQLQMLAIGKLVIRLQMFRLHQATG